MSKVTESIGLNFERFLLSNFEGMISTSSNPNAPDMYSPNEQFWIEAKCGNVLWGPRIKDYQINNFKYVGGPIVYALGYHNFDDAIKRLTHKTERGRQKCLDKNLNYLHVCFLSKEVIDSVWSLERKFSKKNSYPYCMVKRSTLNNIFLDRTFKRHGAPISSAEKYYGFSKKDFLFDLFENKNKINFGFMINRSEKEIFDFLHASAQTFTNF